MMHENANYILKPQWEKAIKLILAGTLAKTGYQNARGQKVEIINDHSND
jgi:hypothetical protein